jgi:hypothetical protein
MQARTIMDLPQRKPARILFRLETRGRKVLNQTHAHVGREQENLRSANG